MTGQEITLTARHPGRESPRAGRRVSRPVLPRSAAAVPRAGPRARPRGEDAAELGAALGAGVQAGDVPVHDQVCSVSRPSTSEGEVAAGGDVPGLRLPGRGRAARGRDVAACPAGGVLEVAAQYERSPARRGSGTVTPEKPHCAAGRTWCTSVGGFHTLRQRSDAS